MAEAKKEVKSKLKFKPLNGAIIVQSITPNDVTEGGLKLPPTALPNKRVAEVLAVDETQEKWVEVGQKVLCDIRTTEHIPIDGKSYGIIHKSQCYGIVE